MADADAPPWPVRPAERAAAEVHAWRGRVAGLPAAARDRSSRLDAAGPPWWAVASQRPATDPAAGTRLLHRSEPLRRLALSVAGAALAATVCWAIVATEPAKIVSVSGNGLGYQQTTSALVGGCGRMYTFADADEVSGTVPARSGRSWNRQEYRTTVPSFGRFWARAVPPGRVFWKRGEPAPRPERLLANMWRGQLVVYYGADLPDRAVADLARLARTRADLGLLVVPWAPGRPDLVRDRKLAFATWNWSQTCHDFVPDALEDFRRLHPASEAPGYDGSAPPSLAR